jgi:lipopolysaccharide export system protein LptA
LSIAGADVGGILTVTGDSDILQTGAIHADALVASTTNGDMDLTDSGNAFADATLSATGDVALHDASALNIVSAAAGGTLTLSGNAGIAQTGAIHADALDVSTTAGDIVLTNTGNVFNTATVATSGSDDASLYDTASLTIAGANVGGALSLTSEGAIGQTGAIHAAALNAGTTGGDVVLSNAGNAFATASLTTAGTDDATLYDASALTISSADVGGTLTLTGGSSIGQSGAIHAAALNVGTTHGAIALTNAGNSFATLTVSTGGSDDASF